VYDILGFDMHWLRWSKWVDISCTLGGLNERWISRGGFESSKLYLFDALNLIIDCEIKPWRWRCSVEVITQDSDEMCEDVSAFNRSYLVFLLSLFYSHFVYLFSSKFFVSG